MNSQRNSYEEVFERNERMLEVLQSQQPAASKKVILQHLINDTFMLPMFAVIPTPPPPSGEMEDKCFLLFIQTRGYPFDVFRRIIGPRGSTVKSIQRTTGCKVVLHREGPERVRVHFSATDYGNIAAWRIEEAKKRVMALIEIPPDGQDTIKKLQLAELAVHNGTFKNRLVPPSMRRNNSRFVGNTSQPRQNYNQVPTSNMRRRSFQ
ncbi:Protein quaking-B [Trichinella patagoniensis]|uniref:Protein quaking-B n=1 Tax=Trichinella patagoniensis TaxID=990121 RepID=A0A0V0ZKP8_9BILA|nr:Protein quaking-B [Trichinella patagoniensis]